MRVKFVSLCDGAVIIQPFDCFSVYLQSDDSPWLNVIMLVWLQAVLLWDVSFNRLNLIASLSVNHQWFVYTLHNDNDFYKLLDWVFLLPETKNDKYICKDIFEHLRIILLFR